MITKQKAFQKLTQIIKLILKKAHQEKNTSSRYRTRISETRCAWSGTFQRRIHSATEPLILGVLFLAQYKWTGQFGCVKTTTRNFVKLQEYAFLKQNNFMRIDELPYHCSLFYNLTFVSRRQFFINIEKYPWKCKKCLMAHFGTTKSWKGGHFFLIKDDFFEDLYFD